MREFPFPSILSSSAEDALLSEVTPSVVSIKMEIIILDSKLFRHSNFKSIFTLQSITINAHSLQRSLLPADAMFRVQMGIMNIWSSWYL